MLFLSDISLIAILCEHRDSKTCVFFLGNTIILTRICITSIDHLGSLYSQNNDRPSRGHENNQQRYPESVHSIELDLQL